MKIVFVVVFLYGAILQFNSVDYRPAETHSLTVEVGDLRNSEGVVQFALYNKDGSIPDEKYEAYYRIMHAEIVDHSAQVVFKDLPSGKYAVNILHDENKNGKIDKGFILPKEGIGFSNFDKISLTNRPKFSSASFDLQTDTTVAVKVIYM